MHVPNPNPPSTPALNTHLDTIGVPQYGHGDTMKAIALSGVVYREAATMVMWEASAVHGFVIGEQYMSRAWTLAERIQRRKKKLILRDFLSSDKLAELDALAAKVDEPEVEGGWEGLVEKLFLALYCVMGAAPPETPAEQLADERFLSKSPLELVGLTTANLYEANISHLIEQLKIDGPFMQQRVMSDLRSIKSQAKSAAARESCAYHINAHRATHHHTKRTTLTQPHHIASKPTHNPTLHQSTQTTHHNSHHTPHIPHSTPHTTQWHSSPHHTTTTQHTTHDTTHNTHYPKPKPLVECCDAVCGCPHQGLCIVLE